MRNFAKLDTTPLNSPRSYFRSAVTRKASSTARETFCAVIPTPSNFSPSTHAPSHTPRYAPARTSHRSPSRATYPTPPPHHTPASHPCTTCPITPPHHAPAPHTLPHHHHPKVACNSQTGVTQIYEAIRTSKVLRGNCMRNCGTPRHPISRPTPPRLSPASRSRTTRPCPIPPTLPHQPSPKSHAIPEQE